MTAFLTQLASSVKATAFITFTAIATAAGEDAGELSALLAVGAPFSWGDNEHSLVQASRLQAHCEQIFNHELMVIIGLSQEKANGLEALFDILAYLGDFLVDLES